jgi:hypothetical protein
VKGVASIGQFVSFVKCRYPIGNFTKQKELLLRWMLPPNVDPVTVALQQ